MRALFTSALERALHSTATDSEASGPRPCIHNQSRVLLARPAASTVGVPTMIRLSARSRVLVMAGCSSPVPESVMMMLKKRSSSAQTRSYSSRLKP
jgi:hypothetical protein